jgi:hypothetical protein
MIIKTITKLKKLFSKEEIKEEIKIAHPPKQPKPSLKKHHRNYKDLGQALQEMPDQVYKQILSDGSNILQAITGEPSNKKKKKSDNN